MSKSTNKVKLYLAIAAISLIQGLQIGMSPVIGAISEHYTNVDVSLVQMLITIPAFVSVFSSILVGVLVLKVSKKHLLLFSCALAAVAGLLPIAVDNFYLLFVMRAVYGISLGFSTALNTAVVSEFFEGDERVTAMGFQAATVGAGMMILSAVTGWLGKASFVHSYYVNIAALVSFILILFCLPDTGKAVESESEKVSLNKKVIPVYCFVFLEFFFLITFSTNIAMHIGGALAGNSSVSGVLTSVYAGSQIIVGLILGQITKLTGKLVLPTAMMCFAIGAMLLVVFPDNYMMLIIAALFCGFSQGIYCPSGFVEVSNAVPPVAVALASAGFNAAACAGQTLSPSLTNLMSKAFFGSATTEGVFLISAVGMCITSAIYCAFKLKSK